MNGVRRYAPDFTLPPYTYVTGKTPHPLRDPEGHAYEQVSEDDAADLQARPLEPARLVEEDRYREGVDLFNAGFYWEAHEAWEELWLRAGRTGLTADFLKGLIKLAAAGVKLLEDRETGVTRHLRRATELLESVAAERDPLGGVPLRKLIERIPTSPDRFRCERRDHADAPGGLFLAVTLELDDEDAAPR